MASIEIASPAQLAQLLRNQEVAGLRSLQVNGLTTLDGGLNAAGPNRFSGADVDRFLNVHGPLVGDTPGMTGVQTIYRARAINTTNQVITAGVFTKVKLDSVATGSGCYDPNGDFDTVNNWYVAPVPGFYLVIGFVEYSGGATGNIHVTYFVNGAERQRLFRQGPGGTNTAAFNGSDITHLNAGDQVELVTFCQLANGTLDNAISTSCYMVIEYRGL